MDIYKFTSQPARAVWIEMMKFLEIGFNLMSQPARAVWIEIPLAGIFQ